MHSKRENTLKGMGKGEKLANVKGTERVLSNVISFIWRQYIVRFPKYLN
jgi:hypothetical protein